MVGIACVVTIEEPMDVSVHCEHSIILGSPRDEANQQQEQEVEDYFLDYCPRLFLKISLLSRFLQFALAKWLVSGLWSCQTF